MYLFFNCLYIIKQYTSKHRPANGLHLSELYVGTLFLKITLFWPFFQSVMWFWNKISKFIYGFDDWHWHHLNLRHNPTLTVPLTHHCKPVILKTIAFPPVSLPTLFVTWSMLAAGACRTCLVIVSGWDQLVNIEKLLEATRTILVTLQPISLLSLQCTVNLILSVVFIFCFLPYVFYPTEWTRKWIMYKRHNSLSIQNTYFLT